MLCCLFSYLIWSYDDCRKTKLEAISSGCLMYWLSPPDNLNLLD